jgi:putative peptidoglycan lipid II flippase
MAALTGVAVNVALKVALVGSLAQVGLALATAVGAWINLVLILFFAIRRNFLEIDRAFLISLVKLALSGIVLAAALWFSAHWLVSLLAGMTSLKDETALGILIVIGAIVYGVSVLALFGGNWLRSLLRAT